MSVRLFEEFQKKNFTLKVGNHKSVKGPGGMNDEIVIAIPLKNSQNGKPQELNEEFIKVIEYEYAVRYLEVMGIEPNQKMIQNLLKHQPLSSCELTSGWNNSGSLADVLYIYPYKKKKKTFENNKDELLKQSNNNESDFQTNQNTNRKKEPGQGDKNDEKYFRSMLDDHRKNFGGVDINKRLYDSLPAFKKKAMQFELGRVKQELNEKAAEAKRKDLNMSVEDWKYKFLYPFGNIAPLQDKDDGPSSNQISKLGVQEGINGEFDDKAFYRLTQRKYLFPLERIHKQEWLKELQQPINITAEDILRDLYKFVKDFPIDIIPHMTEEEMIARSKERDLVKPRNFDQLLGEGYKQSQYGTLGNVSDIKKPGENDTLSKSPQIGFKAKPLHFDKQFLTYHHIQNTFKEIHSDKTARLIGLVSHFVYWVVFGHINQLPLDNFHLKQLFVSILQCITQLEMKYSDKQKGGRIFTTFVMPMILLTVRIGLENILKNNYPKFMEDEEMASITLRLINGAITEVLDPKIYYSRFSFLESGKEAIDLKHKLHKNLAPNGSGAILPGESIQLPNVKNKYYTRSTLVKNLIPQPSEGKVRALFGETPQFQLPKIQRAFKTQDGNSRSPERNMVIMTSLNENSKYMTEQKNRHASISPFSAKFPGRNLDFQTDLKRKDMQEDLQRESRLLDMINRVQMFQIAGEKINKQMIQRKMSPVFQLKISEAKMDQNYKRREHQIDNSRLEGHVVDDFK